MNQDILNLQRHFNIPLTGEMDNITMAAIRNYQLKNSLNPDGKVSDILYNHIFGEEFIMGNVSTDLSETGKPLMDNMYLPEGEYFTESTNKEYIFLHHTAGWSDPYSTIKQWTGDPRGKIATKYVIGGINSKTGDPRYDGVIVEAFPGNGYAWHLGAVNSYMHKHSIGIEICNFGWLTKRGANYYTYTNTMVRSDLVCDLGYTFRGYQYWHSYSSAQIDQVRQLIVYLATKHGINIKNGIIDRLRTMSPAAAFEYYDAARDGNVKGLLSHTSVRRDKFDIYPHPHLIDMLKSL